jgi:hypothetical protein
MLDKKEVISAKSQTFKPKRLFKAAKIDYDDD